MKRTQFMMKKFVSKARFSTKPSHDKPFKHSPRLHLQPGMKHKLKRLVNAGKEYEEEQAVLLQRMIERGFVKPEFEIDNDGNLVYETTDNYEQTLVQGLNTLKESRITLDESDPLYTIQKDSIELFDYDMSGQIDPEDEDMMAVARYHLRLTKRLNELSEKNAEPVNQDWYKAPFVRLNETNPTAFDAEMDVAHETSESWLDGTSKFMMAKGKEREEMLDPELFADHLPDLVDLSKGYGLSIYNPIVVQSHGEDERIVGCWGNCGHPDLSLYDDNVTMRWWVLPANAYTICGDCGLFFYCAGPEFIAHLNVNMLIRMHPEVRREFIELHVQGLVDKGEVDGKDAVDLVNSEEEISAYNIELLSMLRNMIYNQHCTEEEAREAWKASFMQSQLNIPELQTSM